MNWMDDNKGNILVTAAAILFGVFLGLFVHGHFWKAEAVLGGAGNLTTMTNPHNLSTNSAGIKASDNYEICIFCHAPHSAIMNVSLINGPLWNHTLSEATYIVKTSGTLYVNATVGNLVLLSSPPDKPDGTSRMCLSCHDGTVALGDVHVGGPIGMTTNSCLTSAGKLQSGAGCNAYIGTDLTTKHVVSIPMNMKLVAASAANCLTAGVTSKVVYPWDASNANSLPNTVFLRPTTYTFEGDPGASASETSGNQRYKSGYNYGVQCSTCHDPHFWTNSSGATGDNFLVAPFNNLCNACHVGCP